VTFLKPKTSARLRLVSLALAAAPLAACVVGPDYHRPEIVSPAEFRGQPTAHAEGSIADLAWWEVFGDPALQGLIAEGLANNLDLKVAVARIERARALVGVARSEARPQLNYGASVGVENTFVPDALGQSADTVVVGTVRGGLEAAWEFDVWGRIRRSTEAAQANLLAEEDVRRAVRLTLASDLAAGYFRLLELDRELAIAQESAGTHKQTFDLFGARFEAGRDSRLPVERAQAVYESSSATIADLRRRIAVEEDALSVLVGAYPRAISRGRPLIEQVTPAAPVGSTTALLQRRPDILAAEQRMVEANAQVGVAVANNFPRIGLSALAGVLDANFEGNGEGFGLWGAAMNATGPIFTGGRLKSIEQERRAHFEETTAQYRKTVLTAFQETSDALAAQATLSERRAALERQVASLRKSAELALTRYQAGRASYFEVLEAQQQLFPTEDALAQTQRDQLLAVVSLYKALGGGWQLSEEQWREPRVAPPPGAATGTGQ
jgi:multidrug efflux system outer membrane protein